MKIISQTIEEIGLDFRDENGRWDIKNEPCFHLDESLVLIAEFEYDDFAFIVDNKEEIGASVHGIIEQFIDEKVSEMINAAYNRFNVEDRFEASYSDFYFDVDHLDEWKVEVKVWFE